MTTPTQFANQLAALHTQYHAGALTQAQYASALAEALTDYNMVGTLADRLQQVIDLNSSIINSIRMFQPDGVVDLVSDLPTADPGKFYVVQSGSYAYHGFLRVNGLWVDMGLVRGPVGPTPNLTFKITAVDPTQQASALVTGTPENPIVQLGLLRALRPHQHQRDLWAGAL